jgi:hypothetical protein
LDENAFLSLLDVGLRSSIAPKPIRPPAGVKCLSDQSTPRLGDVSPASFTPQYTRRFEQQAEFIPSISKWLAGFQGRSRPHSASYSSRGREDHFNISQDLQANLWMTVANGSRNHDLARKLHPLWTKKKPNTSAMCHSTAGLGMILEQAKGLCDDTVELGHEEISGCEETDDEILLDVGPDVPGQADCYAKDHLPQVASATGFHRVLKFDLCDLETEAGGDVPVDINRLSLPPDNSAGPCRRSRRRTGSLSCTSDVSMPMLLDAPIRTDSLINPTSTIGGPTWLTQNVIRMHPLRQHEHEDRLVDNVNPSRKLHGLYQKEPGSSRLGLGSDDAPLSQDGLAGRYTVPHFLSRASSSDFSEHDLIQEFENARYVPADKDSLEDWPVPMSGHLGKSSSNTSLADMLGDDHLLWHMWKRRGSVAPRGEQDIIDMKMMYETDPDMKVLGGGWDLDHDDLGSGSSEDSMLQKPAHSRSPRRETQPHDQPRTPTSEPRPPFPAAYPSSSSSSSSSTSSSPVAYVGRSNSDSKPQRRGSLMKRFSWGGRRQNSDLAAVDMTSLNGRPMEVKRRKTLVDYEMMDQEVMSDDSNDMLF